MSAVTGDGFERRMAVGGEVRVDLSQDSKIRGYAIVFNTLSVDLGGFKERILPEAVNRTFSEASDVRALVDHDPARILGRTRAGTLEIRKDARGLKVAIDPPNTTSARDILESVSRGDVTGMSFRFRALDDDWHMEDGMPVRDVTDMLISEVSIVTFPAYPDTDVGVAMRSLAVFQEAVRPKRSRAFLQQWHKTQLAK